MSGVRILFALWLSLAAAMAAAQGTAASAVDAQARRAADLAAQLRCLVCQNQTIAESNADLAVDLRRQIDEQIKAGRSDGEIVDFMVLRYGDFVLYRPPFKPSTALLWLGPALLGLLALGAFVLTVRARRQRAAPPPLTAAEHEEAARLIAAAEPRPPGS